jgi:PD-(D/E)XK endonuclease
MPPFSFLGLVMNKRNKRKPKITDKKLRGEWAEMHFMVRATDHDLPVSRPWGESRSYDFVVGWPRRFVAVQVKSTTFELEKGYICSVCGGNGPYPPGSFDFLAAYVVYDDAWYIIPEEEVRGLSKITLYPQSARSKYVRYREAWHLLGAGADPVPGHIGSIQGCAEEFSAECAE